MCERQIKKLKMAVDVISKLWRLIRFFMCSGEDRVTKHYVNCSEQRLRAIECLLWNADDGVWYDYHLKTKAHRRAFYPSNIFPLFVDAFDKKKKSDIVNKVLSYIEVRNMQVHVFFLFKLN